MTYVKRGFDFLPDFSVEELEARYKEERNTKAKLRILCAIHRKNGKTILEIAEITRLPKSTVSDHLRRLEHGGFQTIHDIKNKGATPKLTNKQLEELQTTLLQAPSKVDLPFVFWTTRLVHYFIRRRFKKAFTLHGVRKLLYRLGFTRQKPRQIHHKGNREEQERFKKTLGEELRDMFEKDTRSSFWTKHPSC